MHARPVMLPIARELLGQISSGVSALGAPANRILEQVLPGCRTEMDVLRVVDDVTRRDYLDDLIERGHRVMAWDGPRFQTKRFSDPNDRQEYASLWEGQTDWSTQHFWVGDTVLPRNLRQDFQLAQIVHNDMAITAGLAHRISAGPFHDLSLSLLLDVLAKKQPNGPLIMCFDTRILSAMEFAAARKKGLDPVILTLAPISTLHNYDAVHPHPAIRHDFFHQMVRRRTLPQEHYENIITGTACVSYAISLCLISRAPDPMIAKMMDLVQGRLNDAEGGGVGSGNFWFVFKNIYLDISEDEMLLWNATPAEKIRLEKTRAFLTALVPFLKDQLSDHPLQKEIYTTLRTEVYSPLGLWDKI